MPKKCHGAESVTSARPCRADSTVIKLSVSDPFASLVFQCPDSATDYESQSDTDEEPVAKHRRLSPAAELSFRFGGGSELQHQHGSQEIFQFYGDAVQCYVSTYT